MNTVSLSVSRPTSAKGNCLRNSVNTVLNSVCSRTIRGAHSVQPVAMSVSTRVWMKLPRADGPLCATRSASTNPGAGSFHLPTSLLEYCDATSASRAVGACDLILLGPAPMRGRSSQRSLPKVCRGSRGQGRGGRAVPSPQSAQASTPSAASRRSGLTPPKGARARCVLPHYRPGVAPADLDLRLPDLEEAASHACDGIR